MKKWCFLVVLICIATVWATTVDSSGHIATADITCIPAEATTLTLSDNVTGELTTNDTTVEIDTPYTFTTSLTEGSYEITCATESASDTETITIDTTKPAVSIISPVQDQSYEAVRIPLTFTVDDANLNECHFNVNGNTNNPITDCANTNITYSTGAKTFNFFATDKAGNEIQETVTFTVAGDTARPTITDVNVNQRNTGISERTVIIEVETNENTTCKYDNFDESFNDMEDLFDFTGTMFHNLSKVFTTELNKTYYILCEDLAGNKVEFAESIFFDVKFGEQATLIKDNNRYTLQQEFVEADEKIRIDIDDENFITRRVEVTFENALEDIEIKVKEHTGLPADYNDLDNVIKVVRFTTENIEDADLKEVEITLQVDDDDVEVYSLINEEWVKEDLSGDSFITSSLSYIAVTEYVEVEQETRETEEETSVEEVEETVEEKRIEKTKVLWWTTVIALGIMVIGLIYFSLIHKKDFYGEE